MYIWVLNMKKAGQRLKQLKGFAQYKKANSPPGDTPFTFDMPTKKS